MLEKLDAIEGRYEEIDRLLADPELSADYTRIQSLVREQASIRNIVVLARKYREVLRQLDDVSRGGAGAGPASQGPERRKERHPGDKSRDGWGGGGPLRRRPVQNV